MNFIHFSPHFPENYQNFSSELAKLGINVFGIGDCPYDQLSEKLKQSLTEYYLIHDMENYEEVLKAVGFFTHKYGKIDRFESLNEHWLQLEAKIRTDFNIPGVKLDEIEAMKLKSKMKELFQSAGVNTARGRVIVSLEDAKNFTAAVGYPIIAKPDSGVGALSTYKIHTDQELHNFFETPPAVPYIFEEFVKGNIFSFDGLTNRLGEIVFYTGHAYGDGIMEVVNEDKHVFYQSLQQLPPDLENAGRKIIDAYQLKERFFHIEFFRTDSNQLIVLEANLRPPGGFTTDMFNYANDINIYEQYANVVVNNQFTADYNREYICAYVGRKNNKSYRYSDEEVLDSLKSFVVHHSEVSGVFSSALGNSCYLIRSRSQDDIEKAIETIHETV